MDVVEFPAEHTCGWHKIKHTGMIIITISITTIITTIIIKVLIHIITM